VPGTTVQSRDCRDRGQAAVDRYRRLCPEEGAMTNATFDAFTRQTATRISRRGSLLALGGAGMATALGGSLAAEAKNSSNKKSKKKAKKQAKQKCKKQVDQCETSLTVNNFPQGIPCCQFLSDCNTTQFLTCLFNA
jgi:hypothetical protein